jgi:hypothetical protein
MPSPVADQHTLTSVEDEATEIRMIAQANVPALWRELEALKRERPEGARESASDELLLRRPSRPQRGRPKPVTRERRMTKDLAWRVLRGWFGPDESAERAARISSIEIELSALLARLTLKIEQFLTLVVLAGSPPDYQQDLRESSLVLNRLTHAGTAQRMTLDVFKALSRIVDLVELVRRDVERRTLDDNAVLAARFIVGHLPADSDDLILKAFGQPADALESSLRGDPSDELVRRVLLAAQLVYDLRYSHTPEGLASWFTQSFLALEGRRPVDLLAVEDLAERLRSFARSLRSQSAA